VLLVSAVLLASVDALASSLVEVELVDGVVAVVAAFVVVVDAVVVCASLPATASPSHAATNTPAVLSEPRSLIRRIRSSRGVFFLVVGRRGGVLRGPVGGVGGAWLMPLLSSRSMSAP
jgi:hypothetical protein